MLESARNEEDEEEGDETELSTADLENVAILYDSIRLVRRKVETNMDKKLAADFDTNLKQIMLELSQKL